MQLEILAFGIVRDIVGGSSVQLPLASAITVRELRDRLIHHYPALRELRSLAVAVNTEYASEDQLVQPTDEVVLIPPVAGG